MVYDQPVSEFQGLDEESTRDVGSNWFDLWVGPLNLEETVLDKVVKGQFKDLRRVMVFSTLDFYNHDTVHTKLFNGTSVNFNFKAAFKVDTDPAFLHYLEEKELAVEVWGSEGASALLLGHCEIDLRDLLERAHPSVAPVVHSKAPIYTQQAAGNRLVGTL